MGFDQKFKEKDVSLSIVGFTTTIARDVDVPKRGVTLNKVFNVVYSKFFN